jgi:primosomal protein N' (replication factor Y)
MAVDVPFGKNIRNGYVVALDVQSSVEQKKLRPIAGIKSGNSHIPENLIKLGRWMAHYYCCSYEHAIRTLLPAGSTDANERASRAAAAGCSKGPPDSKIPKHG